ncbi:hypothetical protein CARUB_v10006463mg [Capsella rubella]|uniref:Neprosin PEP catalytic domain-containing protein n=1 Tax=Capsella rubella TaxID=81985 RepID=R0F826_9BRAS|nr:hypothetical protein CARUB_v10006463mg [Capsella rubella]
MKMKLRCSLQVMCMTFLCSILCCSFLMSQGRCHDIVEAVETIKSFEDFEIEQKLKVINKPAVKIIKMPMMSYPLGSKRKREKVSNKTFGHLWKNGVGCPMGTVPIMRVTKDDLLKMKSFDDDDNAYPQSSWGNTYKPAISNKGHYFALARTKGKPRKYNGAAMNMHRGTSEANLSMQFSSGRMNFQIGNEFIQVGRLSYQELYKDTYPRLFVFTNAGGHPCFNNFCPDGSGMILVSRDFTPGLLLLETDYDIAIYKDKRNGDWWLLMGPSWEGIGYWPSSTFQESYGTGIEWGGEVYSPGLPSPPMGNGYFLERTPDQDAYMRRIKIVDENFKIDNTVGNTESFSTNPHCYQVVDAKENFWRHAGHLVLYGGPLCNKLR